MAITIPNGGAAQVFRDLNAGNPHQPIKSEIRALIGALETAVATAPVTDWDTAETLKSLLVQGAGSETSAPLSGWISAGLMVDIGLAAFALAELPAADRLFLRSKRNGSWAPWIELLTTLNGLRVNTTPYTGGVGALHGATRQVRIHFLGAGASGLPIAAVAQGSVLLTADDDANNGVQLLLSPQAGRLWWRAKTGGAPQSWIPIEAPGLRSRATKAMVVGTTYVNAVQYPILISSWTTNLPGNYAVVCEIAVDGTTFVPVRDLPNNNWAIGTVMFADNVIPPGGAYRVRLVSGTAPTLAASEATS